MIKYSEKQRELLQLWQTDRLKRINILEGSVRSGKTWVTLVLWAFWVATMPEGEAYLMVAKTLTSLRRNCLDLLEKLVGKRNFTYSISKKEARLFGRLVYLEGVNDARAESKIRGMTLQGALCDELTLFTEDFFAMLLSRLSMPGAKLFGSTNPDNPNHWLMKNYIERKSRLDMLVLKFLIDDNLALDPEYVRQLKREYTGVFYRRYILGEWCVAEGLVYEFDKDKHVATAIPQWGRYYISVDYGTLNPFSAGLWCVADGVATRVREYYYSGRERQSQMTDEEYYLELEKLAGDLSVDRVIVDPSAASFIETIRRHGRFSVRKANNDVLPGIMAVSRFLRGGRLLIHEGCTDAIREFGLYRWDEKGEVDRPLKVNDHAMDDIRYFCMTVLRRELRNIPELRGAEGDVE